MNSVNRRDFLKSSIGIAATIVVMPQKGAYAANDKVIVGAMGLGGRGRFLAESFARRPDTEVAYLCDPDSRRLPRAKEAVAAAQGKEPKLLQDFRKILEDKDVDVLINATPDHWHALGSIMACQAGKDVYVEKPMSHNLWEGRKMVEAARNYKRVVQVGMQSRSAPYMAKARDYIQSGKVGDVHLVRVFNMMKHGAMSKGSEQPVPEGFNYDLWCGPAAKPPYNPSRRWLNFSDYSCGPIPGDAIHQLDLARFLIGDKPYPDTVSHSGGINVLLDGRDTPDTQLAMYEYGKFTLQLEAALWTPYVKKIPQSIRNSDAFPDWPFSSTRIEVFGTEGF
ncbi:MAG: Gfo/Idh/MocA family protein, partial [Planctomycetota bacterium]